MREFAIEWKAAESVHDHRDGRRCDDLGEGSEVEAVFLGQPRGTLRIGLMSHDEFGQRLLALDREDTAARENPASDGVFREGPQAAFQGL